MERPPGDDADLSGMLYNGARWGNFALRNQDAVRLRVSARHGFLQHGATAMDGLHGSDVLAATNFRSVGVLTRHRVLQNI